MKHIYTAPNSIEAHMISNLLEQGGIQGIIEGEHLQGLERLQSGSSVQVFVNETDYEAAKQIINDIEEQQPTNKKTEIPKGNNSFKSVIVGFIGGLIVFAFFYYIPIVVQKIDSNDDGETDRTYLYLGNRISRGQIDRNFDGKVDLIYKYNKDETVNSKKLDEDFNGTFERIIKYLDNNPIWSKSDTTGDGFQDYHLKYKDGVLEKATFYNPKTKQPIKIQYYKMQKLVSAQIDTNGDGVLDQSYEYNSIEEIIKK